MNTLDPNLKYGTDNPHIKYGIDSPSNNEDVMREPTFGEKLVGITFNPSADDKVAKAKALCAALADLVHEENLSRESSPLGAMLNLHTMGEILNAQMNVVKFLTLKY